MTSHTREFAAIVLAAGQGTRMKSALHKVLHPIAGRAMLDHLLASLAALGPAHTVLVVGHGRDQHEKAAAGRARTVVQEPQLGTGHAVQQAESALAGFTGDILVLYGDVPFVRADTMRRMLDRLHEADAPPAVVLAFRAADPAAYGRVITEDGRTVAKMVEFKDASAAERAVNLCNSGMMAARAGDLFALLGRIGNDNAAGEYYLPDIVMTALADGRASAFVETGEDEVRGINSRGELAAAEAQWQAVRREEAMANGASLRAPETVYFSFDTVIGRDVTVEPHVIFGPGVTVHDGATVKAFSHLEGCVLHSGAQVGPFARLRPGAVLEKDA